MDREQIKKDADALLIQAQEARTTATLPVSSKTKRQLKEIATRLEQRADDTIAPLDDSR